MITALALNPSIDMTLTIDSFTYGGLNRVRASRRDAGGKGLNVALAARRIGAETMCVGFMHRENAALFENKLRENGVGYDFIYCDGETRTNIKVRDVSSNVITELNQTGPEVTGQQLDEMTRLILDRARVGDYMVLTGSLPPACPADYYRRLIEAAQKAGVRCVLDADGARLADGIGAGPFMIKPNRYELELLTGKKLGTLCEIKNAAADLARGKIAFVAVSLGADGALITDGETALFAPRLDIEVSSTVGAGDSMVAGLTAGFEMGFDMRRAFAMGVAAAAAACRTEGTSAFTRDDYEALLKNVRPEEI